MSRPFAYGDEAIPEQAGGQQLQRSTAHMLTRDPAGRRDDGPRDIPPFTDEAQSNWVPDSSDPRPRIALSKNNIEKIVNQAEAALVKADRGVYQRDGRVVSVERVKDFAADGVEVRVQRIGERDDYALQEDLSSAAAFEKFDRRENKSMAADPPMAIVKTLQARRDRLRLPVLTGVLNAPTMRADGSLLTEPGYDSKTGLLFEPLDETFPPIPQRPSLADARKALDKLNALIRDFPFVEDKHRAVALSAILTAPIRRSLPSAPAHAFTAPVAGTGKSKIVDTASIIATGAEAPATGAGKDEEELEKRLASSLLVADPIINIDNVARPIGGDLLCQMLTQATVKPRILGKSKNPTCTTGTFVGLTGNNLVLVGDLTRRAIICRLDARMERPELRAFDFDPVADAKKGRAEYVAAVLTILRAYHVAGRPNRPKPLGSFEAWSELVRGALLWLRCADPVDTMEEIREADPALAQLQAVMSAWREAFPLENVRAADLIKKASEQRESYDSRDFVNVDLREALLAVAGRGGAMTGLALGKWLSANKRRIAGGMRIEHVGERNKAAVWALVSS